MQTITQELLDAAGRGDRDAFELVVRTHFRIAFAVALSVVGNEADAEDVVQDAFIRCWQRLGQCREAAAFAGWMRSVVRSVALNRLERERVRATGPLRADTAESPASPDRDLERTLTRERLTRAMRVLTDAQREVLLLHDLEGFRHADIARLLDVSEPMSRRHLSNARRRMRDALDEPTPRRNVR